MSSRLNGFQEKLQGFSDDLGDKAQRLGQKLSFKREVELPAPKDIPDDPLKGRIEEFTELEACLSDLGACQLGLVEVCERLEAAPASVLRRLGGESSGPSTEESELLARVSSVGTEGVARAGAARERLQEACIATQEAQERHACVRQACQARTEAWICKAKCDVEVNDLCRPASSRNFGSVSLEEKQARLQAKFKADEAWKQADRKARGLLEDALLSRPGTVGLALGEFCGFYATLFEDAEQLAAKCRKLQAELKIAPVLSSSSPAPPPDVLGLKEPEEETRLHPGGTSFSDGEQILVWSDSKKAWMNGVVEKYFIEAGSDAGYAVMAGMVKVSHASGTKYVQPQDVEKLVRRFSGS
jgi:hypothetical protein